MFWPFKKSPVMRFSVEGYFEFSGEVRSFPNLAKVSFASPSPTLSFAFELQATGGLLLMLNFLAKVLAQECFRMKFTMRWNTYLLVAIE
jgi:hypothetical protein